MANVNEGERPARELHPDGGLVSPGRTLYEQWCGNTGASRERYYLLMNGAEQDDWERLASEVVPAKALREAEEACEKAEAEVRTLRAFIDRGEYADDVAELLTVVKCSYCGALVGSDPTLCGPCGGQSDMERDEAIEQSREAKERADTLEAAIRDHLAGIEDRWDGTETSPLWGLGWDLEAALEEPSPSAPAESSVSEPEAGPINPGDVFRQVLPYGSDVVNVDRVLADERVAVTRRNGARQVFPVATLLDPRWWKRVAEPEAGLDGTER